jgi:hypothetical protein
MEQVSNNGQKPLTCAFTAWYATAATKAIATSFAPQDATILGTISPNIIHHHIIVPCDQSSSMNNMQ